MNKLVSFLILILCLLWVFLITNCEKPRNNENGLPKDGDGNEYDTVLIGTQVWLRENLKTTTYNNGTPIPLITDNAKWTTYPIGAYCWYGNLEGLKDSYGALYNWNAIKVGALCPKGYHVPSSDEWSTLVNYLGGEYVAGGKLKEAGFVHWQSPNDGSSNESSFMALPGGWRWWNDGIFVNLGYTGVWWTSTASSYYDDHAWRIYLLCQSHFAYLTDFPKHSGFSVRCVKDN